MQGLQSSSPEFAGVVMFATPLLAAYASLYIIGPLLRFAGSMRTNGRAARANTIRQQAASVRLLHACMPHTLVPVETPLYSVLIHVGTRCACRHACSGAVSSCEVGRTPVA